METDEIRIENFSDFAGMKDEIYTLIERGANDLLELQEYNEQVQENIQIVNDKLAKLKNVSKKIEVSSDIGNKMKEEIDALIDDYGKKSSIVISREELAIKLIDAYNKGDKDIIKKENDILELLTDAGVFWMAKAATEGKPFLNGIANILAYKTDQMYDDSIFIVGDGTVGALELLKDPANKSNIIFTKEPFLIGGLAVGTYSYLTNVRRLSNTGEYTDLDKQRAIGTAVSDAVGYYAWSKLAAKIGGIGGGVIGVGAATVFSWGVTFTIDAFKDNMTGDVIVDTFKVGETQYEVPRNGSGENGTYDVILEKFSNKSYEKQIAGEDYSYTNYKNMLYNNWEDVHPGFRRVYGDETANKFNQALDNLKKIDNKQEARKYIQEIKNEFSTNPMDPNNSVGIYSVLNNDNEFNLEEYYDYHHMNKEGE